jgi:hypothetical protein
MKEKASSIYPAFAMLTVIQGHEIFKKNILIKISQLPIKEEMIEHHNLAA